MWPDFSELTVLEDLRYSASWLHRQSTKKNPKSGFSQHGFDSGNSEWTRPTMTSVCRMLHPLHVNQRCVRSFTALQTTNFKQIPLSQKKKPVQWFSCFGFFFYWKHWFFFIFFSHSRCWTSQTPTARPTVRRHSSIRKTRGSTRRGWRPSWSRAGWTSELLLVAIYSFLSIAPSSSSSQYFSRSFLPHQEKKQQLYQKNSSATLKKWKNKTTKPERTLTCLPIHFKENGGGEINLIFVFLVLNFTFFLLHDVK